MTRVRVSAIAAIGAQTRALGRNNELIFQIPEDMKRFREITAGHPVVMGRKTWESLPEKHRPLPGRTNIVLTRDASYTASGATVVQTVEAALAAGEKATGGGETFIIGGAEVYSLFLPRTDRLYLTLVESPAEGDAFFPEYEAVFTKKLSEERFAHGDVAYTFVTLERD